MRLLAAIYGAASIGAASAYWGHGQPFPQFPRPFCPTITSKSVCSTCMSYLCAQISTVHNPFYCPTVIPTETAVHRCGRGCPPPECNTHYVYPTRASATSTAPPTTTTSARTGTSVTVTPPPSCTPTVTVSVYPSAGCAISSCQFCIRDAFVTMSCGCSSPVHAVTSTFTQDCPSTTPCYACQTGFPFTTTADNCPEATRESSWQEMAKALGWGGRV